MNTYKQTLHRILFIYVSRLITEVDRRSDTLITSSMSKYMDIIFQNETVSPSQLALQAGVSRPAASKMIKQLIGKGLVEKSEASIRRPYNVSLTTKGTNIYNISRSQQTELIDLMDTFLGLSDIDDIDKKMQELLTRYHMRT